MAVNLQQMIYPCLLTMEVPMIGPSQISRCNLIKLEKSMKMVSCASALKNERYPMSTMKKPQGWLVVLEELDCRTRDQITLALRSIQADLVVILKVMRVNTRAVWTSLLSRALEFETFQTTLTERENGGSPIHCIIYLLYFYV